MKCVMWLAVLLPSLAFGLDWKFQQRPPVESLTNEERYITWKFRMDVSDHSTGMDLETLKAEIHRQAEEMKSKGENWRVIKAKLFAYLCDHQAIDVSRYDWFPAIACWDRWDRPFAQILRERNLEIDKKYALAETRRANAGNDCGRWMTWKDFDHSQPVWDEILALGYVGMKRRLHDNWKDSPYYTAGDITADAMLRGLDRYIAQGEKRLKEERDPVRATRLGKEVASLKRIRGGIPETAYDVLTFIWTYFFFSEHLDQMQVRSLSNLDVVLTPYYRADLTAGRTTEAEFRGQLRHFWWQWGSIDNYWCQPVTVGGTRKDGSSEFNEVTRIILDVHDECALPTPKMLVKTNVNTPDWAWRKMLDMARRHRSIVFIGEQGIAAKLRKSGRFTEEEIRCATCGGCYETSAPSAMNGTGGGIVNLLKPVETLLDRASGVKVCYALAQKRGRDEGGIRSTDLHADIIGSDDSGLRLTAEPFAAETWDAFLAAYGEELRKTCEELLAVNRVWESHLADINPANVFSLAMDYSVRTGKDAFYDGSEKGNGTGISQVGLGTAVDALMAVREIVYERKEMSLAELGKAMHEDWKGHETLQRRMRRSKRRWGANDPEANRLANVVTKILSDAIAGKPNSRGGRYGLSGHCARQFIVQGRLTGATPDGRNAGDEMSKNVSPAPGADTEGATALVESLLSVDPLYYPGDYPLDMALHPSSVAGEKGLQVMRALVESFHDGNGQQIQFNVFDAEELKDAQRHPEKYENLQVRVCGWNVRWNDLPKREQDSYILRAERIMR